MSSPQKIYELNRDYNRIMRLLDSLRRHVEVREAKLWMAIVSERDPATGKARFTNDETRAAGFQLRKDADKPWRRRHQAALQGETRRRALLAEIECARGELRDEQLQREERIAANRA